MYQVAGRDHVPLGRYRAIPRAKRTSDGTVATVLGLLGLLLWLAAIGHLLVIPKELEITLAACLQLSV
jgi:hypothetical protein